MKIWTQQEIDSARQNLSSEINTIQKIIKNLQQKKRNKQVKLDFLLNLTDGQTKLDI
jgi:hypothetical protein